MHSPSILLLFLVYLVGSSYEQLPSYIKACSRSDANKKICFVSRANEVLPHILKGDSTLKLPSLSPMRFQKIEANAGNLKLTLKDVDIFGLDTVKVTDMNEDVGQQQIVFALDASRVELIGNYDMDGQIMILPVKGNGPMNISLDKIDLKYTIKYKFETKNGKQFAATESDNLDWKVKKAYFKFDNLFNGNKQLGDNVNKFLNENDQDVLKEVAGAVSGIIRAVANIVASAVLGSVPFDELFLL